MEIKISKYTLSKNKTNLNIDKEGCSLFLFFNDFGKGI